MEIKNVLIIGLGEIGSAIHKKIFKAGYECFGYDKILGPVEVRIPNKEWDVVHICFPQHNRNDFLYVVTSYLNKIKPKTCIIHSTTSIGVCDNIHNNCPGIEIIHMPVRGSHDNIDFCLNEFEIYVGPVEKDLGIQTDTFNYLKKIFKDVTVTLFNSSKETELAKLLSVIWYGLNIAFTQEAKMICDDFDINFDQAYTEYFKTDKIGTRYIKHKDRIVTTDTIYRPIFYPGIIGGKCVIQDVKLLKPNGVTKEMYDFIIRSNERMSPARKRRENESKTETE